MQPARKRCTALFALAAGLVGGWAWSAADEGAARIVAVREITGDLAVAGGTIAVGGISDLFLEGDKSGANRRLWAVTDRGPNGIVEVEHDSGKVMQRTMLAPEFVPSLVLLDTSWMAEAGDTKTETGTAAVERVVPLKGRSGRPLSGRPNGVGRDEAVHSADGSTRLATDPDGVDTEGVVAAGDGGFWLVEEYRPSILRVGADGTLLTRHVPAGDTLPGAQTHVVANLPIRYAGRAHNRGFEAVAITPDRTRLFALLQSPLAGERTGRSVPLLVIDTAGGKPVAEHEYLLDKADADGKLCAMACLGPTTLLVLEQADDGLARLYRVDTSATPIRKTLVADLGPLLPAMITHVFGKPTKSERTLKIEGLAVVDAGHVLLANDNDFGVADAGSKAKQKAGPRSCLWLIELPTPLPLESNT
jgi:hypothetical protein